MNELELLLRAGRTTGSAAFMRSSPDGGELRELTYRAAAARIDRIGSLFASWGLREGSRLLVASGDDQALAQIVIACLERGVVAMILDHQARPGEAGTMVDMARPDAAMVDAPLLEAWPLQGVRHRMAIAAARRSLVGRLLRRPVAGGGFPDEVDALAPAPPAADLPSDLDAYILFTSGSTSRPKAVRISRGALAVHAGTLLRRWGYDADSRILDILPLHHTDGLVQGVLCAWFAGATCVRTGPFRVDGVLSLLIDPIYRERITHLVAVPTMLAFILRYASGEPEAFRHPGFRHVISAAGHLDERLWRDFETSFGVRVCNIYGLTETVTGGCFAGPDDASHRIGSVGVAVDCEVRIVREDGTEAPPGQPGELHMRGGHLMSGYLDDADATAAVLTPDGWLRSGDMATCDADGVVRIVGRLKNLVISGGLNIQPEEVAEFLRSCPGVQDAVAFGIPDPAFTEVLVACVSAGEGSDLDTAALIRDCQQHLSAFKVPKTVVRLPSLPYGPSGKVSVPRARELLLQAQAASTSPAAGDVRSRVTALAARVFHRPADMLEDDAGPGRTPGWDSFAHLSFITAIEAEFGIRLATADVMALRTIGDAFRIVRSATDA